jgi:hypothetical protein
MSFYLLYLGEGIKFDCDEIIRLTHSIEGVYNSAAGNFIESCFEWQFDSDGDSTIGRLQPDCETINLSGRGHAGLKMAFEIQKLYKEAIHITNSDYSFDLDLSGFPTFESLKDKVIGWSKQ